MEEEWKRPFTQKRYIHPPYAEQIITMWPDMKVIMGDILSQREPHFYSAGYRLLFGKEMQSPDFKKVKYFTRKDGAPIHRIEQKISGLCVSMESFCDIKRVPVSYTEIVISNDTDRKQSEKLTILTRRAVDTLLTGMNYDGYSHYDSNVYNWGYAPSDWEYRQNKISNGKESLVVQDADGFSLKWNGDEKGLDWYQRRTLSLSFTINPGESKKLHIAFYRGTQKIKFDYDAEKSKSEAFWMGETDKITKIPGGKKNEVLMKNLVCQCLQMFCYQTGKDYVLPRQGGLQRFIWPVEAVAFLMALDRFGNFFSYTEKAYETFFGILQVEDGEDEGAVSNLFGVPWASITGASVQGLSEHLLARDDKKVFDKFKEKMWKAFLWMERQRDKTRGGEYAGYGIFPPMRSCDWMEIGQSWGLTDCTNLQGYEAMYHAFSQFGDKRADKIKSAYEDYMKCMRNILDKIVSEAKKDSEIFIPPRIGEVHTDPPEGAYFSDGPSMLLIAGVIPHGGELSKKIENWFKNRNQMRNGLTGRMNTGLMSVLNTGRQYDPWAGHTWYTSYGDMAWFYNWLDGDEVEKAEETLKANLKYGMTKEYYLTERYADNDPYYTPWLPNASANGRLMNMLEDLEVYKRAKGTKK